MDQAEVIIDVEDNDQVDQVKIIHVSSDNKIQVDPLATQSNNCSTSRATLQLSQVNAPHHNPPSDPGEIRENMIEKFTREKHEELQSLFPVMSAKWVTEQLAQVLNKPFFGTEELEAIFETRVDELFRESSGEDMTLPSSEEFKVTRVYPKRTFDDNNPLDVHYHIASSIFYKLFGNNTFALESIEIVQNTALETRFKKKQEDFRLRGLPSEPVFGFHGTVSANIESILRNNFNLDSVKRCAHGFGIYFSERPEVSVYYASDCRSLILCKILLGQVGVNSKEVTMLGQMLRQMYGASPDTRSWAIIIGETNGVRDESSIDQILPTYVIHWSKK